jgi:hypothetical protein
MMTRGGHAGGASEHQQLATQQDRHYQRALGANQHGRLRADHQYLNRLRHHYTV